MFERDFTYRSQQNQWNNNPNPHLKPLMDQIGDNDNPNFDSEFRNKLNEIHGQDVYSKGGGASIDELSVLACAGRS
jgi:hypothetical protein